MSTQYYPKNEVTKIGNDVYDLCLPLIGEIGYLILKNGIKVVEFDTYDEAHDYMAKLIYPQAEEKAPPQKYHTYLCKCGVMYDAPYMMQFLSACPRCDSPALAAKRIYWDEYAEDGDWHFSNDAGEAATVWRAWQDAALACGNLDFIFGDSE